MRKRIWRKRAPFAQRQERGERVCSSCGKSYHRRNRLEVWTGRNPGSRTGWLKEEIKLCLACMNVKTSERVLVLAHVQVVNSRNKKRSVA